MGTLPVAAPEIIEYDGQTYIASLLPNLKGIRIAKREWETIKRPRYAFVLGPVNPLEWSVEKVRGIR